MNKTLEIVQEWVAFEERQPAATLEDFCKDYLKKRQNTGLPDKTLESGSGTAHILALTQTINNLSRLWTFFAMNKLKLIGLTNLEEFVFLQTVKRIKSIRKKDLIFLHFIEISSGTLIIDRLLTKGLLDEKIDDDDKRSKRVMITKKGEKVLTMGTLALQKVSQQLFQDIPDKSIDTSLGQLTPFLHSIGTKWNEMKKFDPAQLKTNA